MRARCRKSSTVLVALWSGALLATTAGCQLEVPWVASWQGITISSSESRAYEYRPLEPFHAVRFAARGRLRITPGAVDSLCVSGENDLVPCVEAENRDGVQTIRLARDVDLGKTRPIECDMTVGELRRIEAPGLGEVELTTFTGPALSLESNRLCRISCPDVNATDLEVNLSFFGKAKLAGQVDRQAVVISQAGRYDASGLVSREAVVTVRGMGRAKLCVSERLVVDVGDGCTVYYRGDPVVEGKVSGTGRLVRLD